jgi:drug/metabolite transporter (DMT)-like permease
MLPRAAPVFVLPRVLHGIAWMIASGVAFALLNTLLRLIALQMNPLEVQFLRYFSGLIVMAPFIAKVGVRAYNPKGLFGQLWRGIVHTAGMVLWYMALPHLTLADTTAIGFTISLFTLPLAIPHWEWPSMVQWLIFLGSGVLGSIAHYCATSALRAADASATQGVKFLDLIWMTTMGFLVFGDVPTVSTLIGGLVIVGATTWIARREARRGAGSRARKPDSRYKKKGAT